MLIRGLLEKVKARALLRDVLGAAVVVLSLLGLFFLIYGLIDHLFQFSGPVRYIVASAAAIAAFGYIARAIRIGCLRDALWAASIVEKETGAFNNELVTIAESYNYSSSIAPYMRERLEAGLAPRLYSVRSNQVVSIRPSRRVSLLLVQVSISYLLLFILLPGPAKDSFERLILMNPGPAPIPVDSQTVVAVQPPAEAYPIEELRIILTPPAYTRLAPSEQIDNGEILALAGTRAEVIIKTVRHVSTVNFSLGGSRESTMRSDDRILHRASFYIKEESSYKVTVRQDGDPDSRWEAIYAIKAIKDRAPDVHMNRPASDILFQPGQVPDSIPIRIRATDDFGVGSIKLKYIKAAGEGDGSRFESGEIAVKATLSGSGVWSGAFDLDLGGVGLEPGVSVVLQAEATDNNNLTGPSTGYSENIILQVAEPEKVRIEVDNLSPDDVSKFLTSQRMILIKTEKLHKLRNRISDQELLSRSRDIAIEQRRFRESFSEFTEFDEEHHHEEEAEETGGELAPERHNAALPEIPAGASERVRSMILAIRAMWRAESELQLANTPTAIAYEKEALSHLKHAQKGTRHVTSIAARSNPVDLKRRYQGRLDDIRNRIERISADSTDRPLSQLSPILTGLYRAARSLAGGADVKAAAQKIDKIAEDLIQVRGVAVSSLVEQAAKLKLIKRLADDLVKNEGLRGDNRSDERQKIIKLVAEVCSQMASHMTDTEGIGTIPAGLNLSPTARSKGAAYFRLLSKPN